MWVTSWSDALLSPFISAGWLCTFGSDWVRLRLLEACYSNTDPVKAEWPWMTTPKISINKWCPNVRESAWLDSGESELELDQRKKWGSVLNSQEVTQYLAVDLSKVEKSMWLAPQRLETGAAFISWNCFKNQCKEVRQPGGGEECASWESESSTAKIYIERLRGFMKKWRLANTFCVYFLFMVKCDIFNIFTFVLGKLSSLVCL